MCGCGIRQERVRGGLPGGGETYLRACEAGPGTAARPADAPPRREGAGGRGDRVHRGPGQLPHLRGHPSAELDGARGQPAHLCGRRPDRPACAGRSTVRTSRRRCTAGPTPGARPQVHLPAVRGGHLRARLARPVAGAAHPAGGWPGLGGANVAPLLAALWFTLGGLGYRRARARAGRDAADRAPPCSGPSRSSAPSTSAR